MKHRRKILIQDPTADYSLAQQAVKTIMKSLFSLILLSMTLLACSPLRRIVMKNGSGGEVVFTWELKDLDSLYKSPFFISNSRTTRFVLQPGNPHHTVKMGFGMGSWPADSLQMITDRLASLEIRSPAGTIRLGSSKEIFTFLYNRRRGLGKRRIVIQVFK